MPLLKWKPEYTVNEAEIDSHHQRLFDILNAAYENVMTSTEAPCVSSIVDELSAYTNYHFAVEEHFMEAISYPAIEPHIREHRRFTRDISQLSEDPRDNSLDAARELIIVLGNWVLQHILIEDRKYSHAICQVERSDTGCTYEESSYGQSVQGFAEQKHQPA